MPETFDLDLSRFELATGRRRPEETGFFFSRRALAVILGNSHDAPCLTEGARDDIQGFMAYDRRVYVVWPNDVIDTVISTSHDGKLMLKRDLTDPVNADVMKTEPSSDDPLPERFHDTRAALSRIPEEAVRNTSSDVNRLTRFLGADERISSPTVRLMLTHGTEKVIFHQRYFDDVPGCASNRENRMLYLMRAAKETLGFGEPAGMRP